MTRLVDDTEARATVKHCELCFDALICEFRRLSPTARPEFPDIEWYDALAHVNADVALRSGVFVKWDKRCHQTNRYNMRGCIGSLQPTPLHSSIREFSLKSAFEDRRFQPILESEIPFLSCSVSLLFKFEAATNWQDWEIGVHGLVIRFFDEQNRTHNSATYLPDVPESNQWSREETVRKLIRKTGYRAVITEELLGRIEVTRYRSTLASLTYEQYLRRKEALEAGC